MKHYEKMNYVLNLFKTNKMDMELSTIQALIPVQIKSDLTIILNELVERHGWEELGTAIPVRCFTHDPSVKSSLKFLRKTPWARQQVEELYLRSLRS